MSYQEIQNLLNKVWPDWKPERRIGKGSFGTVYEIRKVNGNMVDYAALKIISIPEDGAAIPMGKDKQTLTTYYENIADGMVQEYDIMSRLKQSGCENVVACDSYVKVPNSNGLGLKLLIQMELLTDLNTYTRRYGFSRQNVIRLGIDICKALESCKAAHVIHRDIKPANLFVSADGVYKLGDFGVAKRLEETGYAGSKQGTILYMAPEVYANQAYDTRADIYSLGLVMYQLINGGELPFDSGTFSDQEQGEALRKRMRGDKIPMPAEDGELGKIVCCACEYNYWDRYSTPGEMRRALEKLLNPDDDKMLLFPVDIDNEIESEIRIRFMSEEGKVLKEDFYQSGQQVVPPQMVNEIEIEGIRYQFMGWEPSVPEKAIDSMDCKAVYKEVESENQENKVNKKRIVYALLILLLFVGIGVFVLSKLNLLEKSQNIPESENIVEDIKETDIDFQNKEEYQEESETINVDLNYAKDVAKFFIVNITETSIDEKQYYIDLDKKELQTILEEAEIPISPTALQNVFYDYIKNVEVLGEYVSTGHDELKKYATATVYLTEITFSHGSAKLTLKFNKEGILTEASLSAETNEQAEQMSDEKTIKNDWSDWTVQLPEYVTDKDYEIKQKKQYKQRIREIMESEVSYLDGWEVYDKKSIVVEGQWSEWSEEEVIPDNNTEVKKQKMYKYRDIQKTEASTDVLDGWNLVGKKEEWGPYGEWSAWSFDKVSESESRQIKTRRVSSYYYFYCSRCGRGARYPFHGYNCELCGTNSVRLESGTVEWFETPWSNSTSWGSGKYYQYIDGGIWWNYADGIGGDNITQYMYSDRNKTVIYYFEKPGKWSEWSETPVQDSETREVKSTTMYKFKRNEIKTIYMLERFGKWSDFTDAEISESENLQVESQIVYSYRKKN